MAKLYIADTATEYEHEWNTCQDITGGPPRNCTQAPFYLNDGADPSTTTRAFVCSSNCSATDFGDLNLNAPVTVPHSLAEIAGDLGYEKWTHTNGSTAVSTAKWTFTGLAANTTYFVCACIPHGYANNTAAHYQGFTGSNTTAAFTTRLNQANLTGWSPLGSLTTASAATAHVTLDDTGPTGTYTAADAMRLTTSGC